MFLVYGNDEYLIDEKIKKLLLQHAKGQDVKRFHYNFDPQKLLDALLQQDLLSSEKAIYIKDWAYFYNKKNDSEITKLLINTFLKSDAKIFFANTKKVEWNNFSKLIYNKSQKSEINKPNYGAMLSFVEGYVKQNRIKINADALYFLIANLPDNLKIIINELDKLSLLNQQITKEVIEKSVNFYAKEANFNFINSLKTNDPSKIIKFYEEEIEQGVPPLLILGKISSSLILANQIETIKNNNNSFDKAVSILNINRYRAKQVYKLVGILGQNKIEKMIMELNKVDYRIKRTNIDPHLALDYFMLKFIE